MKVDGTSVALFVVAVSFLLPVVFGVTIFARWIRTKIIWTAAGRLLVGLGLTKANGTIDDLKQGQRFVVKKQFVDYFRGRFLAGENLTYLWQEYVDRVGHVITFEERTLHLNERANAEILEKLWAFIEPVR